MADETESIRLDKWLWAARFFKTRKLASDAIAGGKVHVNKQRCKASKEIRVGAVLSITKDSYHWEVTVIALSSQRCPAPEAALLYKESPESHEQRQEQVRLHREQRELIGGNTFDHRPNKKERRMIHRFKQS